MPLIVTDRHSRRDLERFNLLMREARAVGRTLRHARLTDEALRAFDGFGLDGCYVGVSWGKDSVVVSHLSAGRHPLVWIRERPNDNPDCATVRDAYLAMVPSRYEQIDVKFGFGPFFADGFRQAVAMFGPRHISGVRAEESAARRLSIRRLGLDTSRMSLLGKALRPIGHWSSLDVFAYLDRHDLPVHPAYGFTMDGLLDPLRLRVDSLCNPWGIQGAMPGDGHGRRQWEARYYREHLAAMRRAACPHAKTWRGSAR